MVITLIGYRGSGKSAVAAPLAARLGWTWCDADDEIERRAGKSIREIFADDGESHFRELERLVLAELLGKNRLIVAAGGGAVLNEETRCRMQNAGPVVWLQAGVELLERRIRDDRATAERRPNLTLHGGRREIEETLSRREPLYRECATVTVATDSLSIDEVVEQVFAAIEPAVREGNRL
jgi:shikimate kinase